MTLKLTASGRLLDLAALEPRDVVLEDVARHLAKLCRFVGACRSFYSVAEHSVMVARALAAANRGPATQLLGLLHDAHEAYLGDWISPVKALARLQSPAAAAWLTRSADHVQAVIELALMPAAGFALLDGPPASAPRAAVKRADLELLATERRDLLPASPGAAWPQLAHVQPLPRVRPNAGRLIRGGLDADGLASPLQCLDPLVAEAVFVDTYRALVRAIERTGKHAD